MVIESGKSDMFTFGKGSDGKGPPTKKDVIPFLTERDFEAEVLRSEVPVVVQFTADWCEPCTKIAPEVEAFVKEMKDQVKVVRVDVDKAPVLAQRLRVKSVPTFMLVAQQRVVDVVVGALDRKKLREMVEPVLPRAEGALKPIEVAQLLKEGAVVPVDTRDAAAFGRAHLPGAQNIPIEEIQNRLAELHMFAGQPVLYCRSGDKSKDLAAVLAESGMPIAFLDGGMLAWEADGLPVERP
jgi:thioredoxin 1/putative thioredoxin